jgi:cytochrome b/b6/petB-like protein
LRFFGNILSKTSYGQIALAMLVICVVSGILLVIPYDVDKPFLSISSIMVLNPAASFIRNIHFWSAQFFLVFSLIHIWDHFNKNKKIVLKKGVWLRLTLGVIIIFMVMLTGFLLKGDADTKQAWRILNSLIEGIPLIGNLLSYSLLGEEGNLQLIYVHHIATFTIFIIVVTYEHSRKIWPKENVFIIAAVIVVIISFLFTAPLHDGVNQTVKGPWYFVGFQEVLHWLTIPSLSLIVILLFLVLIFIIPYSNQITTFISKRLLLVFTILYLTLTLSGMFFRGENWKWVWPWQKEYSYSVLGSFNTSSVRLLNEFDENNNSPSKAIISGKTESCMICHDGMTGFTPSHNPNAIGCYSCHGGNPFDGSKDGAHDNMKLIPGNFEDADISCGTVNCHSDITRRKSSNLMSNISGMISVDRYVFNEQDDPDLLTSYHSLKNSAADEHLKNMCVICHLDNPKTETGPVTEKSRGGGCLACHINYNENASTAWLSHKIDNKDTTYLNYHPSLSMKVTNQHCFGCHSRSGRISTNFEGWHETVLKKEDVVFDSSYRLVEGTRVFRFIKEDIHHKLGMGCIDCHNSFELMGDGNYYSHQENQNTMACSDCHFNGKANTVSSKELDSESAIIASMRFGNISDREFLFTKKREIPLINTEVVGDTAFLYSKNIGQRYILSQPNDICTMGSAHDNVSCSSCHSSWAPSCIGCHNEYDPKEPGYDMLKNEEKMGAWVEFVGEYNAGLPALGVRRKNNTKEIIPVVPGMVLTIDVGSYSTEFHDSLIFHRLFAPSAPHTTTTQGRDCESCHSNPVALGYGKGQLEFDTMSALWTFNSHYQNNPNDNLPEDSWIGFISEIIKDNNFEILKKVSTRSDLFPFSIEEQKRILTVGSCLQCHDDKSKVIQQSLYNFDSVLLKKSSRCVEPKWQ